MECLRTQDGVLAERLVMTMLVLRTYVCSTVPMGQQIISEVITCRKETLLWEVQVNKLEKQLPGL